MTRSREEAVAWGKRQINNPSQNWRRQCLSFVRQSFGVERRIPNAGMSWDQSQFKHRVASGMNIPRGVPVHWETSDVADHIALSIGNGLCLSTDARRSGHIDIVSIDALTRRWGMRLHGWTEDINGVRIYHPRPRKTPNITAALRATNPAKRRTALVRIIRRSKIKQARVIARAWLDRIDAGESPTSKRIASLRADLSKFEVR